MASSATSAYPQVWRDWPPRRVWQKKSPEAGVTNRRGPSGRRHGRRRRIGKSREWGATSFSRDAAIAGCFGELLSSIAVSRLFADCRQLIAHLRWTLVAGDVVSFARNQLNFRTVEGRIYKAAERAYKDLEGIPEAGCRYRLEFFVPPRVRLFSTASSRGPFRSRTPPPRNAPAPECGSPGRNRGEIRLWSVGPIHFWLPDAPARNSIRDAPKSIRLPRNSGRGPRGCDMPRQSTPTGHPSKLQTGIPPAPFAWRYAITSRADALVPAGGVAPKLVVFCAHVPPASLPTRSPKRQSACPGICTGRLGSGQTQNGRPTNRRPTLEFSPSILEVCGSEGTAPATRRACVLAPCASHDLPGGSPKRRSGKWGPPKTPAASPWQGEFYVPANRQGGSPLAWTASVSIIATAKPKSGLSTRSLSANAWSSRRRAFSPETFCR